MQKKGTLKKQVSSFPLSPGVYIMKDESLTMLYVGKAKALRKRVLSYLRTQNTGKIAMLMSNVHSIEYIVTENEYDALLLEHNLIKEHHPKYNILLRDDKTFPMIKITHEEYPRVLKTRKVLNDKAEYFGPYIDVFLMNTYLELIEKNFSLRRCNKIKPRAQPCLYYHLNRCTAVCAGLTSHKDYLARVKKIRSLLKGHTITLKKDITLSMHKTASNKLYEQAAQHRDALSALELLEKPHTMIDHHAVHRNYIGIASRDNHCCIVVVDMKDGRVTNQDTMHLSTFDSIEDSLEQFLLSYYASPQSAPPTNQSVSPTNQSASPTNQSAEKSRKVHLMSQSSAPPSQRANKLSLPEIIYAPLPSSKEILAFFETHNTKIQTPETAQDASMIRFAKQNAYFGLQQHIKKHGNSDAVFLLQKTLRLKTPPMRIEGFDIATMNGTHTTASMVSFFNGVPEKSQYRHFTIKSLKKGKMDDFQSIQEVVSRRYTKLKNEHLPLPDLILIDGGIGQVNSAKAVLDTLSLDIPIIGLAKKKEEIYFPGKITGKTSRSTNKTSPLLNPLQVPINDPASKLLQFIRNETHRFATMHREKKQIKDLQLNLYTEVRGIGEKKSAMIMTLFPHKKNIEDASIDTLCTSLKISPLTARALQDYVTKSPLPTKNTVM